MEYDIKKKLVKLSNKQLSEDIKKYIKSSYDFYYAKTPEIRTLAKRLREEYSLKDFYRIFNKLWKTGYQNERVLALTTLQFYKEEFDMKTWSFLKPKLKEVQSWDKADYIGSEIIGNIFLKFPELKKDILKFSESKNIWLKRIAMLSNVPLIRNKEYDLAIRLIQKNLNDKEEYMQKAVGILLREIGNQRKDILRKILSRNKQIPGKTFLYATENFKHMRKIRPELDSYNFAKWFFWKN